MRRGELGFRRPAGLQATGPPERRGVERDGVRLLVSTPRGHEHARFLDLPRFLPPGTVLVVNDSATLPASLPGRHERLGPVVVNLCTHYGRGLWLAEARPSVAEPGPLPLEPGDLLEVGGVRARAVARHPGLPRLWFLRAEGDLGEAMRRHGSPIRYAYLEPPYPLLSAYQTIFARAAGSAEMPSAARPFTARLVTRLRERGVEIASVTLHAGVSSHEVEASRVEDETLYAEPFAVPAATAEAVDAARREGRPVVAVGTTVVRALESAWRDGRLRPAAGFTRRFVHPGRPVRAVDGLLTGLHDPFASHLALLYALAPREMVRRGYAEAVAEGCLWHELGDSHLLLPAARSPRIRYPRRVDHHPSEEADEPAWQPVPGGGAERVAVPSPEPVPA